LAIHQAWTPDPQPDYYLEILPSSQKCDIFKYPITETNKLLSNGTVIDTGQTHTARDPLKWWMNCVSYKLFDTPKLLPILFNLALMPLVYLLASALTKDRIVSLITLVTFIELPIYHDYIGSGTYDQIWSFFLILAVYISYRFKRPGLTILSFLVSLTSKTLGLLYMPSILYTLYDKRGTSTPKKILLVLIISITMIPVVIYFTGGNLDHFLGGSIGFHQENINHAIFDNFGMLAYEVPIILFTTFASFRYGPKIPSPLRKLCLVWIGNAWLTTTIIYLFSTQYQFVYRFVPLAVFLALFIGITINDLGRAYIEKKLQDNSEN
jgi:hypothetical protein